MAKPSYFYVLYCKDNSLYGGYTTDLTRRLAEHNAGTGAKYTRPQTRRPARMLYAEKYQTRSEATKAEYSFKQKTRAAKEHYLEAHGVPKPVSKPHPVVISDKTEGEISKNGESEKL